MPKTKTALQRRAAKRALEYTEPYNKGYTEKVKKFYAKYDGPKNKAGTKWNLYIGSDKRMSAAPAKQVALVVAQLTGVLATKVQEKLQTGSYHTFNGNQTSVVVSKAGTEKGEGILDWMTKKIGESGLFRGNTPAPTQQTNNRIKESFPTDTKTLYQMNQNTYDNRCMAVGDWKCMSGTKTLQFYMKGNTVIVCVRGTASIRDLMADIKITFQNVRGSTRFNEDLAAIKSFQQQYPPGRYNYYFTGHSLGGALIDEYLKDGLGTSAISFNPAVQKEFYNSANHHRIYNTQDPLYDLMGRHVPSAEVRQFQGKEQSFLDKMLGFVPVVNDAAKALKGHSLDNYIGGMKRLAPSVVERPHMRGPNMLGGFSFMDDFLKPVARLAIKGSTLGTVDPDKLMQGKAEFEPGNALPYIMKSGQNLLSAKMGDPSGLIEQGIETAQGNGRCRWVDKGSRYPDWQEVCDGGGITALKRINTQGFRPIS